MDFDEYWCEQMVVRKRKLMKVERLTFLPGPQETCYQRPEEETFQRMGTEADPVLLGRKD